MSKETQLKTVAEKQTPGSLPVDLASIDGLAELADKVSPLIQAGRFNNIVDLLSLISDNIEFLDEAALEKSAKVGEDVLALGWTTGNAVRMASAQTAQLEKTPSLFQLFSELNNPDVRRSLHFFIGFMQIIGKQMKAD